MLRLQEIMGLLAAGLYVLIVFFPIFIFWGMIFKKNKEKHDLILIEWLGVLGVSAFLEFLRIAEALHHLAFLIDILYGLFTLHLFFFFSYGKKILGNHFQWSNYNAFTLLPCVLWLGNYVFLRWNLVITDSFEFTRTVITHHYSFRILNILVAGGIVITGIQFLKEIKALQKSHVKFLKINQLHNFRKFVLTVMTIFMLLLVWELAKWIFTESDEPKLLWKEVTVLIIIVYLYFLFGLFCFRQQTLFKQKKKITSFAEDVIQLNEEIKKMMILKKPYLDPDFSIAKLAVLMERSPGKISEALKVSFTGNFLSYLHMYRVSEAKMMMQNAEFEKYSLVAIGLESGFNSKATFNRVFKNQTGMTPSAFRSSVKNKD